MHRRVGLTAMIVCSLIFPAGCGRVAATNESSPTANRAEVVLHVPGMAERRGLT